MLLLSRGSDGRLIFPLLMALLPCGPVVAAEPEGDKAEIVVRAERPVVQRSIDRQVFVTGHDLQATTGSLADVLKNLPSVDVDAQGNVSLRGNDDVEILIDGKPSTLLSKGNRGEALQQMSAGEIDHIEIITNPSARFRPDGSSGVINIIRKKRREQGASGTIQATAGSDGRYNFNGAGAYNRGPFSLNGTAAYRRDVLRRSYVEDRHLTDLSTLAETDARQDARTRGHRITRSGSLNADYDLDARDTISGGFSYSRRTGRPRISDFDRFTDAAGALFNAFDRFGTGPEREVSSQGSARWRHQFGSSNHFMTVDVRRGETVESEYRQFTRSLIIPPGLPRTDYQQPHTDEIENKLTVEYSRPLASGAKLVVGYDLQHNENGYRYVAGLIDPVSARPIVDPAAINNFEYDQRVHAVYATYERALSKTWTAVLGLRVEDANIKTHLISGGLSGRQSYVRLYPTLHVEHELPGGGALRSSYSRRVTRLQPNDLNPFGTFLDPFNLRMGNPNLRPQQTDSYEASGQSKTLGINWNATFYFRKTNNLVSDISRAISSTTFLTTKDNVGRSRNVGVELALNGKISSKLSFNSSGSVYASRIDASNLGVSNIRSITSYSVKANLDWRMNANDMFQINGSRTGKTLTAQGFRLPSVTANFGYRHRLREGLSAVFTLSDIFDSLRERTVIDTPGLRDLIKRRRAVRTATLALIWTPGGGKKNTADARFDYSGDKD